MRSRIAATSAGSAAARSPSRAVAASPGSTAVSANATRTVPITSRAEAPTRLRMNSVTPSSSLLVPPERETSVAVADRACRSGEAFLPGATRSDDQRPMAAMSSENTGSYLTSPMAEPETTEAAGWNSGTMTPASLWRVWNSW